MQKILYNSGTRFGKWEVLSQGQSNSRGLTWSCKCDCGTIRDVPGVALRNGKSASCGCANTDGVISKLWKGHGEIGHNLWNTILVGATSRGYEITVTIEDIWQLFLDQDRKCALTGIPLEMFLRTTAYRTYTNRRGGPRGQRVNGTASLDRIDNTKGYIPGNIQWVHKEINRMKGTLTSKQFVEWCKLVAKHNFQTQSLTSEKSA